MAYFSIVMPCHNSAQWMPDAVASLNRQGTKDFELIVADDASTEEGTLAYLAKLESAGRRVLRHDRNRGAAAARNAAISAASGTWIVPLDSDDMLPDDTLAELRRVIESNSGADFVNGHFLEVDESGNELGLVRSSASADIRTATGMPWIGCTPYRRSLWERVGGYDDSEVMRSAPEDWDFWVRCVAAGARGQFVDRVMYVYRKREGSVYMGGMKNEFAARSKTLSRVPSGFFAPAARRDWLVRAAMMNATTWRRAGRPWAGAGVLLRLLARHGVSLRAVRALAGCIAETALPPLRRRYTQGKDIRR